MLIPALFHSVRWMKKTADMTFVNTGLDHDYAAGLLVDKAKNYSVADVKIAWITPDLAD